MRRELLLLAVALGLIVVVLLGVGLRVIPADRRETVAGASPTSAMPTPGPGTSPTTGPLTGTIP